MSRQAFAAEVLHEVRLPRGGTAAFQDHRESVDHLRNHSFTSAATMEAMPMMQRVTIIGSPPSPPSRSTAGHPSTATRGGGR